MAKTITVVGGHLFQVAAQYLGDATQWNRIAEASGLTSDPVLPVGVQSLLVIPEVDSTQTGGIYNGKRAVPPQSLNVPGKWNETFTWNQNTWA